MAVLIDFQQETESKIRHLDSRNTTNEGKIAELEAVNTRLAAELAALKTEHSETYELLLLLCRHFASFTVAGTEHQLNQRDRTDFAAQISRILAERAAAENSESESPAGQTSPPAPPPAPEAAPPPAPAAPTHDSSQDSS